MSAFPHIGPGSKPHEHSPMKPLYKSYKGKTLKLIGYQCQCGCGWIYTPNGTPSDPQRLEDKHQWLPRYLPNKSHGDRLDALKHDSD